MFKATYGNGFWVLPSRARPHNLTRFFETCRTTGLSTCGYVLIDADDWKERRSLYDAVNIPTDWGFMVSPPGDCLGDKMRYIVTTPEYQDAEWVGFLCDDQVPITKDWDLLTIAALNGKNFVSGNDEWQPHRLVGAVAFSKDIVTALEGLYPPNLKHSFSDDIFETAGRDTGCWTVLPNVIIHHHHHLIGKAPHDESYKMNDSFFERDARTFKKWLVNDYGRICNKIKEVMK